jgi:hypothetical protein
MLCGKFFAPETLKTEAVIKRRSRVKFNAVYSATEKALESSCLRPPGGPPPEDPPD